MARPALQPLLEALVVTPGHPRRLRVRRLGWWWCLGCQSTPGGLPMPQRLMPEPWPALLGGVLVVTLHQNT